MTVETVSIDSLTPDPGNARKHGDRNLQTIAASLRRFGQQKPIVVDSRDVVRAGNGQLAAAKSLGWKRISIIRSDLPPRELTAYAVADNRTGELAEWDAEVLGSLLVDPEIGDVGFTDDERKEFLVDAMPRAFPESGEIRETFEVVVECEDENEQRRLYERLTAEGHACRLFTL
jgi:ParB/Sulfiredoxin domain